MNRSRDKNLDISHYYIGDFGIQEFISGVRENPTITKLLCHDNPRMSESSFSKISNLVDCLVLNESSFGKNHLSNKAFEVLRLVKLYGIAK